METNQTGGNGVNTLSPLEKDTIGEVMNISMGAAATAVSQMLDRQVEITAPEVAVQKISEVRHEYFEPALMVKIVYTTGITGFNVMVFRQRDMHQILNTLMGIADDGSDDFVFDDLSISAACEVMNQMMGSSATALAEFLGKIIDISPPTAMVMEGPDTFKNVMNLLDDSEVAIITFRLTIKEMLDSEFIAVMTLDLVREIIGQFVNEEGSLHAHVTEAPDSQPPLPPLMTPPPIEAPPQLAEMPPLEAPPVMPPPIGAAEMPQGMAAPMQAEMPPVMPPPMGAPMQQAEMQPQMAGAGMPPPMAAPYPMGGQMPAAPYQAAQPMMPYAAMPSPPAYAPVPQAAAPPLDIRPVEFPEFPYSGYVEGVPVMGNNMDLIMNVPLDVSIEIGTTKRRIRDIMNFTSGTVVELDKQAGAPVDVVVNGQLIAHGDVVVIDDNFGVRITEIVGTKELLNSLSTASE